MSHLAPEEPPEPNADEDKIDFQSPLGASTWLVSRELSVEHQSLSLAILKSLGYCDTWQTTASV